MYHYNFEDFKSANCPFDYLENPLSSENLLMNKESNFSNYSLTNMNLDPLLGLNEYGSYKASINSDELNDYESIINNNDLLSLKNNLSIKKEKEEENNIIWNKADNSNKTGNNKSTEENSSDNNLIVKNANTNSDINKKNKTSNLGRKRKNAIYNINEVHNKESDDNIRIKFKRLFINNLRIFINYLLSKSPNIKLNGLELKKLDSSYVKIVKKDKILKMLDLTVGEFLSNDICKKLKKYPKDHNKKVIKLIYEENDTRLIKVLNRSIRNMMKIFCRDKIKNNIFKNYKRLGNYINELYINKKKENDNFIKKFIYQAKNFEDIYKEIDGRKEGKDEEKKEKEE